MQVSIYNTQKRFPINPDSIKKLARRVILAEGASFDEVSLHFVGKKKICQLHQDFFDDPSFTDCISFPMDNSECLGYSVLGEVFICPEAASRFINKHGGDLYEEISLYVVHGLLHLLGYDDIEDDD
nr:rRNA maturation RNase YbeY [Parachlamydiaceae bacterium]